MNYYLKVLKNYAVFSGRARRSEYWMFLLFNIIFGVIAMVIDNMLGLRITMTIGDTSQMLPYGYVYLAYALAVFIPGLAVSVRRLHDVGKSGWFFFIVLIPLIGAIWLIVLFCTDSIAEENEYGANPKAIA